MKKSLLALAVLGAFAGAASAQSSVTLYGRVDLGVQNANKSDLTAAGARNSSRLAGAATGSDSASPRLAHGGNSRLGFRGVEDLGNGLKANFLLEHRFQADDGTQSAAEFWRQSWVGLSGGFGEVRLGRDYTPAFHVASAADPFGWDTVGQAGALHTLLGLSSGRFSNQISYKTPNFAGLTATASISLKESAAKNGGNAYGANVQYTNGPLALGLGLEDSGPVPAAGVVGNENRLVIATAAYDFGVVRPSVLFGKGKSETATGAKVDDRTALQFALTAPLFGGEVKALAARLKTEDAANNETDLTKFGLGYHYPLSKRTKLYTDLGTAKEDNVRRRTAFDVGVSHSF